ncbi:MAG: thioredoxin family protein [Tagaea sp.]|nr:thioredoxin family protein [Tagaea sp.]
MIPRRTLLALSGAALLATPALARPSAKFTEAAFKAAQDADKSILVEITAVWCPACKAQAPVLERLLTSAKFRDYVVFTIDFDSEKDAMRRFEARLPGTLLVFKGEDQMGRSLADTDPVSLAALLEMGL